MMVKLNLKPDVEAGLLGKARARGLSLEAYLDQVLQNAADVAVTPQDEKCVVVNNPRSERASAVLGTQQEALQRTQESAGSGEIDAQRKSAKPCSVRPAGRKSLAQLFAESPFKGLDLTFERDPDTGRPINL